MGQGSHIWVPYHAARVWADVQCQSSWLETWFSLRSQNKHAHEGSLSCTHKLARARSLPPPRIPAVPLPWPCAPRPALLSHLCAADSGLMRQPLSHPVLMMRRCSAYSRVLMMAHMLSQRLCGQPCLLGAKRSHALPNQRHQSLQCPACTFTQSDRVRLKLHWSAP